MSISFYTTRLEDVADLLAEDVEKTVGQLVGMKECGKTKLL